jgi:hypothetical protein
MPPDATKIEVRPETAAVRGSVASTPVAGVPSNWIDPLPGEEFGDDG